MENHKKSSDFLLWKNGKIPPMQRLKIEKKIPLSNSIDTQKKWLDNENNDVQKKDEWKMEKWSRKGEHNKDKVLGMLCLQVSELYLAGYKY